MPSAPDPLRDSSEDRDDRRVRQVVDVYLSLHRPIPGFEPEDLYQEGRIAWFLARGTYRADRGASRATYIGHIVENRLRDLARRSRTAGRGAGRRELSLDLPVTEDGDLLADLLPDDSPLPEVEAERSERSARLGRVREVLRGRQRDVFDALADEQQRAGVARDLGVSRDTVYEDIRRIQNVCRDEGLEDFLD